MNSRGPFSQFDFKSRCLSLVILFVTSDPAIPTTWCFIKAFPNLLLIIEEKCAPVTNPYGETSLICPQSSKSKIKTEGKKEWPYILPDLLSLRDQKSQSDPTVVLLGQQFLLLLFLTCWHLNIGISPKNPYFWFLLTTQKIWQHLAAVWNGWILAQWTFEILWPPASASPLPRSGEAPVHRAWWEADVFPIIQVIYQVLPSRWARPGRFGMSPRLLNGVLVLGRIQCRRILGDSLRQ